MKVEYATLDDCTKNALRILEETALKLEKLGFYLNEVHYGGDDDEVTRLWLLAEREVPKK